MSRMDEGWCAYVGVHVCFVLCNVRPSWTMQLLTVACCSVPKLTYLLLMCTFIRDPMDHFKALVPSEVRLTVASVLAVNGVGLFPGVTKPFEV